MLSRPCQLTGGNERGVLVLSFYLNQLHEGLGMKWDPDIENVCFRRENGPVKFDYELTDFNTYRIIITQ